MRRVLILSYYFPPTPSVGCIRMGGLAKYLPECGWQPTVVTPHRSGRSIPSMEIQETADGDLARSFKKLLGISADTSLKDTLASGSGAPLDSNPLRAKFIEAVKALVAIPDTNRPWSRRAVSAARELMQHHRFDAVITSSPPPSVHLAGEQLARAGLPWVADLRDPWWDNHNSAAPSWRRRLDRWLEKRTLRHAQALVTVSHPLTDRLLQTHPQSHAVCILSGYDPELVNTGLPSGDGLTISHTGTFYQGRRDPSLFFSGIRELLARGRIPRHRLRIRLFARHESWIAAMAEEWGIADVIEMLPWMSREAAIRAQWESQVLLLIHPDTPEDIPVYTGKIFEYLAARRPILMVGGLPGVLSELIEHTRAGVHVRTPEAIASQLEEWWAEIEESKQARWHGNEQRIEAYSQPRMAREFARVLEDVSSPNRSPR